jgi:hypothetical protein
MSRSASRVLAWTLFAVFMAIWTTTLLVVAFGPGKAEDLATTLMIGYALVGAIIAYRLPDNAVGWLLLGIGIVFALAGLSDANSRDAGATAFEVTAWLSVWTWGLAIGSAATLLPLVFPTGRLPSPRWRPVLWLAILTLAVNTIAVALEPGDLDIQSAISVENPLAVGGEVAKAAADISNLLGVLVIALCAASLVVRFRRAGADERQQLKWFAYAGAIGALGLAVATTAGFGVDAIAIAGWFTALLALVVGIPFATGMAILRHRLYDIDVVIRRTVVYASLTATLVGVYVLMVLLLQVALGGVTQDSGLAVAASTLAVAALFQPFRTRIQEVVHRRFFRSRYDARHTLEEFSSHLRDQVDLAAIDFELRAIVTETVQPAHVSLWLRDAGAAR